MSNLIIMHEAVLAILLATLGGFFWQLGQKENYKVEFGRIMSEILISGSMGVIIVIIVRSFNASEYFSYILSLGFGWAAPWLISSGVLFRLRGKDKRHLSSVELNRTYAIVSYILFTLIVTMAIIEIFQRGILFYVPTFIFNIICYIVCIIAAVKYWLDVENRVLVVCLLVGSISFAIDLIVLIDDGPEIIVRTAIILLMHHVCLFNRLMCVKWLRQHTKMLMSNGGTKSPDIAVKVGDGSGD